MRCAYWGKILTATAKMRGARGAVIDGYHRDTQKVLEQQWPIFSRARYCTPFIAARKTVRFRTILGLFFFEILAEQVFRHWHNG